MKNCMNVAAGVFGVMVSVALLVCGWNVLAPAKWCWVERGIAVWGGAIATVFLFLFAAGYEREKKSRENAPRNARPVFARKDDLSGYAEATSLRNSGKSENAQDVRKKGIKEMATDKALDKSVHMGCSVAEHEEAVNRVDELLQAGRVTDTRKGNLGRHDGNDRVQKVSTLESSYDSGVSGERCAAIFSVHEEQDSPPYAYFMYTKKERPKQ